METIQLNINLTFNRKNVFFLLFFFFLCWHPGFIGSETLTLTTYYPAPYGGYVNILTTGKTILARDGTGIVGPTDPGTSVTIGSGVPTSKLHVFGRQQVNDIDLKVTGRIQTGDANNTGGIWLDKDNNGFVGNNTGNIGFWVSGAGAGWNTFQIIKTGANAGNIGINTQTPTKKLHVAGDVRIGDSGGLAATGSLYGLCDLHSFGPGVNDPCVGGAMVTGVYANGTECPAGGQLLDGNGGDMTTASWIPHMNPNCAGQMLCCRLMPSNN